MEQGIVHRLREEYFDLLPDARRIASRLETEIRCHTLSIEQRLKPHEQIVVKSRVKDCESAVAKVRRKGNQGKGEGNIFDPERPGDYFMLSLRDLAGVRVLVFPNRRLKEVNDVLRHRFQGWEFDPINDSNGLLLAPKYCGHVEPRDRILAEYQVVPMLLGLYWDVEHAARYKSVLKGSVEMAKLNEAVEGALTAFEQGIANSLPDHTDTDSAVE